MAQLEVILWRYEDDDFYQVLVEQRDPDDVGPSTLVWELSLGDGRALPIERTWP